MKRSILTKVFSRKPEGPLYHYTTQSGLLGIIGKRQIWATHTQYLNDRREYLHALDLVYEEINALLTEADELGSVILNEMRSGISGIESINVCVCSFSEDRDSLSQWRAYGGSTSGYAIGLPGDFVMAITEKSQWYLARCIYEPSEQRALIRALVEEVFEENVRRKQISKTNHDDLPLGGSLGAYLNRYAPILKDRSFQDEREWRIISRPLSCKSELFDFREGNSMLIPYYKLPLADEQLEFLLHEVVVGPTPHSQHSKRSVTSFLVHHGLRDVPIEVSSVPFRNW